MWDWNRAIVRPLVHQAFARSMESSETEDTRTSQPQVGSELLERYMEWAAAHDRFTPIRVGTETSRTWRFES